MDTGFGAHSEPAGRLLTEGGDAVYLSPNHTVLYEKYGFEYLTEMTDVDGDPSQTTLEKWQIYAVSMLDLAKGMDWD